MQHPGGKPVFLLPLATAAGSLLLFFAAVAGGWFGEATGTGSQYCEAARPGLIRQPVNTWSNLGFVVAGLLMARLLWCGAFDANVNALTRTRFYAVCFTSLVILAGPCSMALHATETEAGGHLDVLAMHLVAAFITAYALQRLARTGAVCFAAVFALLAAAGSVCQALPWRVPVFGHPGNLFFALLITATTVMELLNSFVRRYRLAIHWALLSCAAIIAAFAVWNVSQSGCAWCDPWSPVQGHGLWHLLCALSLFFLFRYYVSEHAPADGAPAALPLNHPRPPCHTCRHE